MSVSENPSSASTAARSALALRAGALRDQVRAEAVADGRDDLVTILDSVPRLDIDRPVRVIVAGSLKRGKSTLVNSLVGRPLLSPVGIDVTTACWVEIGYGDEQATALIADAGSPGNPTRRPIDIAEVAQYVALSCVAEPVLGVEVRIRSPLLKDLVLVDTPGVAGLDAGHSRITLTALRQADALLFVSDCTQPILAFEADFLESAAQHVATVLVAVAKSDIPGCEAVVEETRDRLSRRPGLTHIPVFAVSPPLADQAHEIDDRHMANWLDELSGLAPLVAALRERTSVGRDALRIANCAHAAASVAQILAGRRAERAADPSGDQGRGRRLEDEAAQLEAVLADRPRFALLIANHLLQLRVGAPDSFSAAASDLRRQYQQEAQRGPAAQLETLAPRMTADLTAAGVAALDLAASQSEQLVRTLLVQIGAAEIVIDIPVGRPSDIDLGLSEPEAAGKTLTRGLSAAGSLFPTMFKLITGSSLAVSVLTGPGAIAASVAVAACAGWWRVRSGDEQDRRSRLRSWVDSAATQASANFRTELDRRVSAVQQYLDRVLPDVLDARREELARVQRELAEFRAANAEAQRLAQAQLLVSEDVLRALAAEATEITRTVMRADSGTGNDLSR